MERFNPIIGDPVAESAALLRRLSFFLLFLVLPLAAVVGRRTLVIVAPISIILLVISAILDGSHRPLAASLQRFLFARVTWLSFLFIGWCALSLLWSPFPMQGSERFLSSLVNIGLILLGYFALPDRMRSSNLYLLPIGVGLSALLAVIIELSFLSKNQFSAFEDVLPRGLMVQVLLFWPALSWLQLRQRNAVSAIFVGVLLLALLFSPNFSALSAFIIGLAGYVGVRLWKEKALRIIAGSTAAILAFAPLLPFLLQPVAALFPNPAYAISLKIVRKLVLSDPLQMITGQGYESAIAARMSGMLDGAAPYSTLFQIWYELGIVGAWSASALIMLTIGRGIEKYSSLAPSVTASFLTAFTFACLGNGISQSWWILALASTILIFVAMSRGQFRTRRPSISTSRR